MCVMVMFGRDQEKVWKEQKRKTRNSSYPFGVKLEGKSFNFLSYSHAYKVEFFNIFLLLLKKKEIIKGNTLASSKNRARLNNSG